MYIISSNRILIDLIRVHLKVVYRLVSYTRVQMLLI